MIIRRVYKVVSTNQLLISVPKGEGIKEGDYVNISKVPVNFEVG